MSAIKNTQAFQDWQTACESGKITEAAQIEFDNFKEGVIKKPREELIEDEKRNNSRLFQECLENAKRQYGAYQQRRNKRKTS